MAYKFSTKNYEKVIYYDAPWSFLLFMLNFLFKG